MRSYTDLSITAAKALAKEARRYGYFHGVGEQDARVTCPECKLFVVAWLNSTINRNSIVRDLDRAVVDHLTYGDCTAHPDKGE